MKKLYTFLSAIALSATTFGQGTILSLTVSPAAPTTLDNIYMYATVQFGSSGCNVVNKSHSTSGSTTTASALHCIGMASAICTYVDTFNLGMLPAGVNTFNMTLSSGMGGPPCSPGFAPDDNRIGTFTVTTATGIGHLQTDPEFITLFPNPMTDAAIIKVSERAKLQDAELKIMDITGRVLKTITGIHNNEISITRENLPAGVYFYQVTDGGESVKGKFLVE